MTTARKESIIIDLRFDHPNDYTPDGHLVNSFDNVKRHVDVAKTTGFDSITIQTNVPIDPLTGKIKLYDDKPGAFNPDKSLPDDIWKIVDYAKSLNLQVVIKPDIVDYQTDHGIWSQYSGLGPNFSEKIFFQSVADYMKYLADLSQQHDVDAMYVGSYQSGFDTARYQKEWQYIVDNVRSVFDGKLTYQQQVAATDNIVWKMVDYISAGIYHDLSDRHITDSDDIVDLYYRDDFGNSTVADLLALKTLFPNKPVVIDGIAFDAGSDSVTQGSFFEDLMSGKAITQDDFHYDVQTARIQAIFDLVGENSNLNDMVSGFSVRELMPWTDAVWIQDPRTSEQTNWNLAMSLNFNLTDNKIALDSYREKLFDGDTIVTGTDSDDSGRLSDSGNYYINGRDGTDTLELVGKMTDSSLVYDGQYHFLENNNRSVTLDQVERVKFDDGNVMAFDFEDADSAGGIYRLYQSIFHRDPDAEGFGYWVNKLDQGMSQVEIANHMLWNSQFQKDLGVSSTNGYGDGADPRVIVSEIYHHMLDREPDAEGLDYWSNQLASKSETVGQVICDFANITQYDAHFNDVMNNGMHYQYWDPVWG